MPRTFPSPSRSIPADAGKPALDERPLLGGARANELVRVYKMLASATRLRVLHALVRAGERAVGDLADDIDMSPQAVSNQLQRLLDRRIVTSRREGSRLFYRIADPCIPGMIDLALCLLEESGRIPTHADMPQKPG